MKKLNILLAFTIVTAVYAYSISCKNMQQFVDQRCNTKFSKYIEVLERVKEKEKEVQSKEKSLCKTPPPYKYDVITTATEGFYQEWQTKILWDRLEELRQDPCTPIASITRILSTSNGQPLPVDDGIHPTFYTKILDHNTTGGFIVINRPWATKEWLEQTDTSAPYILLLEPDHLLVRAPPCTATEKTAVGAEFMYMTGDPVRKAIAEHMPGWNLEDSMKIPATGPSPLLIHRDEFKKMANDWFQLSVELQHNPKIQPMLGWVLEMWGFGMACVRAGVHVEVDPILKIEPPGQTELHEDTSIIHYTYGMWYAADGNPLNVWSENDKKKAIWRFDKRDHYTTWPTLMTMPMVQKLPAHRKYIELLNHGLMRLNPPSDWELKALANGNKNSKVLRTIVEKARDPKTKDLMVAMSNKNVHSMLRKWANNVLRSEIQNWAVACLDAETYDLISNEYGEKHAIAWFGPKATHGHAVSGAKYAIIAAILQTDTNVLMSDIDVIVLKDPFPTLVKDSDVEGMSDGFDHGTAYGYDDVFDDPKMGWSRYAHSFRVFNMNVGWIYTRASEKTIQLMYRVASRMLKPGVWDQAEFNNELWTPSGPSGLHYGYETWVEEPDRVSLSCTVRIMPFNKVCNSKVWMHHPEFHNDAIVVHFNYHNNKEERMDILLKERFGDVKGDEKKTRLQIIKQRLEQRINKSNI